MPAQGRKRTGSDVAPIVEGEIVPASLEELDEPAGREGEDELDDDAVEMAEDDEDEDEDEDEEEDEDEDEDAADEDDAEADEDEDDEDDEDEEDEGEAEADR
jgi:ribonuclease E